MFSCIKTMLTIASSVSPARPLSAISIKSADEISASRCISQIEAQHSARAKASLSFPRCVFSVAIERSSKRNFAYDRSRSLISNRSAIFSPARSATTVDAPATSSSTLFRSLRTSPLMSYKPTARRCGRSSFESAGTNGVSCLIVMLLYTSPSISKAGRNVFTPAVCSQVLTQLSSLRPLDASSSTNRSSSVVFPQACFSKYF